MNRIILSEFKKHRIEKLYNEGWSFGAIAKMVKVSKYSVYRYYEGKGNHSVDLNSMPLPKHLQLRIEREKYRN